MLYEPYKYWDRRLKNAGMNFKDGVGYKNVDENTNKQLYVDGSAKLINLMREKSISLYNKKILDIGCGNGFYASICDEQSALYYTGIDITDALFPFLQEKFPNYRFVKKDITKSINIEHGYYDIIFFIDVSQHIVEDYLLYNALSNIDKALNDNGYLIITSWDSKCRQVISYYEVKRPFKMYIDYLKNYNTVGKLFYRDKYMYILHKE